MPATASPPRWDLGHVPAPGHVKLVGVEQPAPQVRGGRRATVLVGQAAASAGPVADHAIGAHQPFDSLWLAGQPRRRSWAVTRGAPWLPWERAWMRRISPTSLTSSRSRSDGPGGLLGIDTAVAPHGVDCSLTRMQRFV